MFIMCNFYKTQHVGVTDHVHQSAKAKQVLRYRCILSVGSDNVPNKNLGVSCIREWFDYRRHERTRWKVKVNKMG